MDGLDHLLPATAGIPRRRLEFLTLAILAPLIGALAIVNLDAYPTISGWDEGIYLQFAENLAHHGEYATRDSGEFRRLSPVPATGPTVIVPVALSLLFSGDSLFAGRLVIALYLLAALGGGYLLTRKAGGGLSAVYSLPLFLAAGYSAFDTLAMGRQVLGEVPAFAFMLPGLWAWIRSWTGGIRWLITASVLLTLAVVTKNQLIWVVGPGVGLLGLIDWALFRQLSLRHILVPLASIAFGYCALLLLSLWIVGPAGVGSYLEDLSAATAAAFLHANPQVWLMNLKLLFKSKEGLMATVVVGYGLYCIRQRSTGELTRLILPMFTAIMLLAFVLGSLPWPRLLYPGAAMVALGSAVVIGHATKLAIDSRVYGRRLALAISTLVVALLAGPNIAQDVASITGIADRSPSQFAATVDQAVPSGTPILGWEWEVEFYSDRPFVHPPSRLFPALVDQVYNHREAPILQEPRISKDVRFLIVGPFATQTRVFDSALGQEEPQLVSELGPYRLYGLR